MKIIIIGAGNWGTTLAILFSKKHKIYLWTIDQDEADRINSNHANPLFNNTKLSDNIIVEKKFSRKINKDDIVIIAIPSRKIESLTDEFLENNETEFIAINASKGVEHSTLKTVSETVLSN